MQIAALAVENSATVRISYKSDWQNLNYKAQRTA